MTLSTATMVEVLAGERELLGTDLAAGRLGHRRLWPLVKFLRGLRAALRILLHRAREPVPLYLAANSRRGLWIDAAQLAAARLRGWPVAYHHHVYTYIAEPDRRMALVIRLIGDRGLHLVACERMADELSTRYGRALRTLTLPPLAVTGSGRRRTGCGSPLVLGFLSNLTLGKGLAAVIETLERALHAGLAATLVVAGPLRERAAARCLHDALERRPEAIVYRGPLYGTGKTDFFDAIDVFLFPSTTTNESWGIVLNESLAAGVPVITLDRACLAHLVGREAGRLVARPDEFVPAAIGYITAWAADEAAYARASEAALARAAELSADFEHASRRVFDELLAPTDD